MRYLSFLFHLLSSAVIICAAVLLPAAALASTRTVSPGDTLYKIGLEYGVSVEVLMSANSLVDYMIYPGQVITVPGAPDVHPGTGQGDIATVQYTVQNGDTLYWIGVKYGVYYQKIMAANSLESENIYPGMVFIIPGAIPSGPAPEVSRGGYFQRPSAADVDLLARLITAEAGNQPYEGKVAVGAVVMNRTLSKDFPKTIPGVINQYNNGTYQFEPVMNGWINKPATPESFQAARDALNGADPTKGALYFYSNWVTKKWLTSKEVSRRIGELVFAY
ncbi:MAG: cell wall hydrolase [Eubacteriales bacterium]